ncbi:MAG: L28 family ribosomal protein [Clostridiales bacterium]
MAKCEVCEKSINAAKRYSFRGASQVTKKFKRLQKSNVKKIKIDDKGTVRHASVCVRCIRADKVKRVV